MTTSISPSPMVIGGNRKRNEAVRQTGFRKDLGAHMCSFLDLELSPPETLSLTKKLAHSLQQ